MIWVDRMVEEIKKRNLTSEWVDDMKTPSGRIHVGSLLGVVYHDVIYKALLENKIKSTFSYVFEDHDPMDGMPPFLDAKKWGKYMGMQLYKIPSPEKGYKNFGQYFALEFKRVFEKINCHPQIIWVSDLYLSGKMNDVITMVLDNASTIREIYLRHTKRKLDRDWYPFNVVCEKCQKIGTTKVFNWDGQNVHYRCLKDLVFWAVGCGYEGKTSPYDGRGKMPWKVEWPAKWKVIGVTVEGAGKDHMSKGGSHDISSDISTQVFKYPVPYSFIYEWFTIQGRKMSSSKGVGTSAKEISEILPAELLRFLIVRTPVESHLDFNPYGDTILNLFDDYDRCLNAYFDKAENKLPQGKKGEVLCDFARIIELSAVTSLPKKRLTLPRFRTIVNLLKNNIQTGITDLKSLQIFFEKQKNNRFSAEEIEILDKRIKYAKIYKNKYENQSTVLMAKFNTPDEIADKLTLQQRFFLQQLSKELSNDTQDRDIIQNLIFDILKKNNCSPRDVFKPFYQILTGKDFGPKAADLILEFGLDIVQGRINKVLNLRNSGEELGGDSRIIKKTDPGQARMTFSVINKNIFSIDPTVVKKYPSIVIGIAVIKGVIIKKNDPKLTKEIEQFIDLHKKLNNETISSYPEVQCYRRLYKEMGIDWHSRRPSPEALLRRIVQEKELYKINTCVDAYNLIVMKHRVSIGAFDYDKMAFPTILKFPNEGDEILLLGDKEPTKYKPSEIAYFDQNGGYDIDFNYRDAQRTAVTENTTDIILNIDGVYGITRNQVENSLKSSIENIQKYCGGKLDMVGIVEANK